MAAETKASLLCDFAIDLGRLMADNGPGGFYELHAPNGKRIRMDARTMEAIILVTGLPRQ